MDVLSKVGGFEIAAMTGAFLGGWKYRMPVVIDGVISAVAAMVAILIHLIRKANAGLKAEYQLKKQA